MKKVLFVCVENACRSQMAEGFFNAMAKGKALATSAGSNPASQVHPLAVKVMKEIGIDISNQKTKMLTREMIEEADKVVLMGCGANQCPVVPKDMEDWKIEDPSNKGIEKFREARDKIKTKTENLIRELEI